MAHGVQTDYGECSRLGLGAIDRVLVFEPADYMVSDPASIKTGYEGRTVLRCPALKRPSIRSAFQNIANVQHVGRVDDILVLLFHVVYRMGSG